MISQRVRVKICGLAQLEAVQCAAQAGADAIGLVFYPHSPRAVSVEHARALRNAVPAFISVAALFVNASHAQVQDVIDQVRPDLLQFHGEETPEYCRSFGRRYLRAFALGKPGLSSPEEVIDACRSYSDAAGWLFDSYSGGYGGSGLALDTALLRDVREANDAAPLILAGGLTPETVADSIRSVRPYAVDVSSGVESSPGIKSLRKIQAFLAAVRDTALS